MLVGLSLASLICRSTESSRTKMNIIRYFTGITKSLSLRQNQYLYRYCSCRFYTDRNVNNRDPGSYYGNISWRKAQAENSVLINVLSPDIVKDLLSKIATFGKIKHYCTKHVATEQSFASAQVLLLVEFQTKTCRDNVLSKAGRANNTRCCMPDWTRVLNYGLVVNPPSDSKKSEVNMKVEDDMSPEPLFPDNERTLTEQIISIYERKMLTDFDIRLAFFVVSNLEDILSKCFNMCHLQIFGSLVSGLGVKDCDIDLSVIGSSRKAKIETLRGRYKSENGISQVGNLLSLLPDVKTEEVVAKARVPLIKLHHSLTDMTVDLSYMNSSGPKMSYMLWHLCRLDVRFPQLVTALRTWYRDQQLKSTYPGSLPNNHIMSMIMLFFLQSRQQPVLPTLSLFVNGKEFSTYLARKAINSWKSQNTDSVGVLLHQFFEWFSSFQFHGKSLSLYTGTYTVNENVETINILNPFEVKDSLMDMTRSVDHEKLQELQLCASTWVKRFHDMEHENTRSNRFINDEFFRTKDKQEKGSGSEQSMQECNTVTNGTMTQMIEDTQADISQDTQTHLNEASGAQMVEETQTDAIEDTHSVATEDAHTDVIEDTQTEVTEDTHTDVIEDTQTREIEDTQTDVIEGTQTDSTIDVKSQRN